MPDPINPSAADAVQGDESQTGATPSKGPLTAEQASELLRSRKGLPVQGTRDPLEGDEERDPLLSEPNEYDPLDELEDEPIETEETPEADAEGETPEAEAEPETTDEPVEEPHGRKRVNLFRKNADGSYVYDARERAAMQMADEEGIGFIAAYTRLFGEIATKKDEPTETKPVERTVQEIQAEITKLRAERKAAAKSLDMDKQNELTEQIEDLLTEHGAARERDAERGRAEQTAAQQHEAAQLASMDRAGKQYPDSLKEGSAMHTALTKEIARIEKQNPAFFYTPEWPEMLAVTIATKLGVSPAKPQVRTETKVVKPKQAARPAPAAGGIQSSGQTDEASIGARIKAARDAGDLTALSALIKLAESLPKKAA